MLKLNKDSLKNVIQVTIWAEKCWNLSYFSGYAVFISYLEY